MKSSTICAVSALLVACFIHKSSAVPVAIVTVPVVETPAVAPLSLLDIEAADQSAVDVHDNEEMTRSARGLGLLLGKFGGHGLGGIGGLGGLKGFGGGLGGFGGLGSLKGFGGGFGGGFKPFFGKF